MLLIATWVIFPKIEEVKMKKVLMAACIALAFGANAESSKEQSVQQQYEAAVNKGKALWSSPALGSSGATCSQCHENAEKTRPETYPKVLRPLGRVGELWEMVNFCITNPLKGTALEANDPDMLAILSYIHDEHRGNKLSPGNK